MKYTLWVGTVVLLFFLGLLVPDAACAEEYSPKSVWTDAEVLSNGDKPFNLEHLTDHDLATCTVLLDTSRTGTRAETTPTNADHPITARIVLDLGESRAIAGVRFYAGPEWKVLGIRNASIFTCDDPQGKQNVQWIRKNEEFFPMNYNLPVVSSWPTVQTRYLGIDVNDSWQIRDQRQGLAPERMFNVVLAELTCLSEPPADPIQKNPDELACPEDRLFRDWLYQDHGFDTGLCFASASGCDLESALLTRVLAELPENEETQNLQEKRKELIESQTPGVNPAWKELYCRACLARRNARLATLFDEESQVIYVKHHVLGGTEGHSTNVNVTDRQYHGFTPEERAGSQLCRLSFGPNGQVRHEVLLEKPDGVIRDPNLSYDAKQLVFSMRESLQENFHLYTMDLEKKTVEQITFSPEKDGKEVPCADIEPCYTPEGNIIFTSTRNSQINDCWPEQNSNIFTCGPDGSTIRRLTYDELDVGYPQMMHDGRVLYTRWEYSDRNAYFMHPLFTMNTDGTMQTEYCGNNSLFPASYIQARAIPGSNKVIAIISGHHVPLKGKLALVDRTLGTQDGKGIEFVAGSAPDGTPGRKRSWFQTTAYNDSSVDYFGQTGPQFQNPCALDEDQYLVAYCPEGWGTQSGPYNPPFGVYWMDADGRRELLAFDWWITCTQPILVAERDLPASKPSQVKLDEKYGTFLIQDVYYGPGLAGIPQGTAKKIRVVALEYRAAWVGTGVNAGEADAGYVQTPISLNNGSWDVKHVLGEADIEEDGSAAFLVPARVPVYFQILDEHGYCIQTMRSWSTLQPGETFACIGCHEDKLETAEMVQSRPAPLALKKPPQPLAPFAGQKHPLIERLETEEALDSIENYAGMNAPVWADDPNAPVAGFSYNQRIQPIWDRHCVSCHSGSLDPVAPAPDLSGRVIPLDINDPKILRPFYYERVKAEYYNGVTTPLCVDWKRSFTSSYTTLTNYGQVNGSKWVEWLECRSRPQMLPPYHTGSSKSLIMKYLEPDHYNVQVTENEKRLIACWIDLLIPFCGSYTEANTWTDKEKNDYRYYLEKRRFFLQEELKGIRQQVEQSGLLK
ncbi:MAG: hypothetical protein Q4G68_08265 [Planctomycetia bacterium]|nr:hypothetical protein [Planctomycetia bacterium]